MQTIGEGVAIIPTAPERLRNRDSDYLYRFDSYFYYLCGFPEPEALLVLIAGEKPRSILFCRDKNAEREDRKSTRLNSSHVSESRMPSSA